MERADRPNIARMRLGCDLGVRMVEDISWLIQEAEIMEARVGSKGF